MFHAVTANRAEIAALDTGLSRMRPEGSRVAAGAHCSAGWDVATPWHHHDMHQLLYAFDGAVEIEGPRGRYKVPHQFAVWIPAWIVHRTTIQKVASGSVFLSRDMVPCGADRPLVIAAPGLLREMVMHAMRWPLDREEDATSAVFFECFARLCEGWTATEVKLVLPSSSDTRIEAVLAYTRDHVAAVTFTDVCTQANMSERTLRRHFRKTIGMCWEEYRQRLRLCLALDALDESTTPVGVIAADVGYENQAAFARAFRSLLGVAPSEYRKRQ